MVRGLVLTYTTPISWGPVAGFALSTINAFAFYLLDSTNTTGMLFLTITGSMVYAPTIPLVWAMFADVADYSEWQTGRRFTGMVFATIGFALKTGLALGQAGFLWVMAGVFDYDTKFSGAANAVAGYRATSSIAVGILFAICTALLVAYKLNKEITVQISAELDARRAKAALA